MRAILGIINYWCEGVSNHGWLFIVAHVYPVSFIQDCDFKNKGYDILSLNKRVGYFTGLVQINPYWRRRES